jgi:copper ion binding protein
MKYRTLLQMKVIAALPILFFLVITSLVISSCSQNAQNEKQINQAGRNGSSKATGDLSLRTVSMPVEGMSCGSCVANVKKTVKALDGVQHVDVSLENRTAKITYAQEKVSPEQISRAITEKGYKTGEPVEVKE